MSTKNELRQKILTLLRNQEEEQRLAKSAVILTKLFELFVFQKAGVILFYASFDGEVDTFEMIRKAVGLNKKIALPRILENFKRFMPVIVDNIDQNLVKGPYGIQQPVCGQDTGIAPAELDLVVVPGVAFDRKNNRLGRGGGYYDRFLSDLPADIPIVGLAFDFQIVDTLPVQEHDHSVTCVLSN